MLSIQLENGRGDRLKFSKHKMLRVVASSKGEMYKILK